MTIETGKDQEEPEIDPAVKATWALLVRSNEYALADDYQKGDMLDLAAAHVQRLDHVFTNGLATGIGENTAGFEQTVVDFDELVRIDIRIEDGFTTREQRETARLAAIMGHTFNQGRLIGEKFAALRRQIITQSPSLGGPCG